MGGVWFSIFVALSLQVVFAWNCGNLKSITTCDECIKCGAKWCNAPYLNDQRCSRGSDMWCPSHREQLPYKEASSQPAGAQASLRPMSWERSVKVGDDDDATFVFIGPTKITEHQIKLTYMDSTIKDLDPKNFHVTNKVTFNPLNNTTKIQIRGEPNSQFCPAFGTIDEYITWNLNVKTDKGVEESTIKYHVPCSCACSETVDIKSPKCSGKGDLSCGACTCEKGWKGESCDIPDITTTTQSTIQAVTQSTPANCDRGDISGCIAPNSELECSGNGYCSCGGNCVCYNDRKGSQYFDKFCTDICTTSGYCDACLQNPTIGQCQDCYFTMLIETYNKTLLEEKDQNDRNVWVECTEKTAACDIKFVAMKDGRGDTHIMIVDACNMIAVSDTATAAAKVNVTVPVILSVLALVAAAAAVAGYMMWKNRAQPPLTDSQYQNIDAEDCTGENPLYKPPTSSFKNPTYGKW